MVDHQSMRKYKVDHQNMRVEVQVPRCTTKYRGEGRCTGSMVVGHPPPLCYYEGLFALFTCKGKQDNFITMFDSKCLTTYSNRSLTCFSRWPLCVSSYLNIQIQKLKNTQYSKIHRNICHEALKTSTA